MAGVRGRLDRLQQESEGFFETIVLEGGTRVRYAPEEMLDALSAAIRGEEHRLLPLVRRKGTRQGLAGLINALEASHARREGGDEDDA
jgi:hypothetical protein